MELLQTITRLSNTEESCPFRIKKSELLYNTDDVRMLLRLTLDVSAELYSDVKVDICCYDKSGLRLSVMEKVPYVAGGMMVELPSLMTVAVEIIVRRAKSNDGIVWISDSTFPEKIVLEPAPVQEEYDDTAVLDTVATKEAVADVKAKHMTKEDKKEERRKRFEEEEEIRQLIKNDPEEKRKRIITRIVVISVIVALLIGGFLGLMYKRDADSSYRYAMNLYNSGRFEEARPELEKAGQYSCFGEKKNELYYAIAMTNARCRDFKKAAIYFKKLNGYKEGFANYRSIINAYSNIVAAGKTHSVALKGDGTVLSAGDNSKGQCNLSGWHDVTAVAAGGEHTVGLSRHRVVMAAGDNSKGQCNVTSWKDIVDISAGDFHTVGVTNVGRVMAEGDNIFGQCDVDSWSGIVAVSAGSYHTLGLKLDGTVVATGSNENGECNVSEWKNIILVAAGNGYSAGLTGDGKIMFVGRDEDGISAATKEENVLSIAAGAYNLFAVYDDGSVKSFGSNNRNQSITVLWKNIVIAGGGENHGVGITSDGTALGVGANEKGQANVTGWSGIDVPMSTIAIRKGE